MAHLLFVRKTYIYNCVIVQGLEQNKNPGDKGQLLPDMRIHFSTNKVTTSYRGTSWFLISIYLARKRQVLELCFRLSDVGMTPCVWFCFQIKTWVLAGALQVQHDSISPRIVPSLHFLPFSIPSFPNCFKNSVHAQDSSEIRRWPLKIEPFHCGSLWVSFEDEHTSSLSAENLY